MTENKSGLLVVGSVAYDSVRTHAGSRTDALGGSATYFSLASSNFSPVSVVAVVGEDFRPEDLDLLRTHGVDVSGIERKPGKTFRWAGVYDTEDVNTRETLDTQLNVFADFSPDLTSVQREADYLFLANIHPALQLEVLSQMSSRPKLVALDSMNFWIDGNKADLSKVIERVDILIIDENEVRQFAGEANLVAAAKAVLRLGPRAVVIKRGEHGVLMYVSEPGGSESAFACPALPLDHVIDPTGAGDSFAGGFMGYLSASGVTADALPAQTLRQAVALGTVMGSITVQGFSMEALTGASQSDIQARFDEFHALTKLNESGEGNALPWAIA
jgi:sugar/nucleoside kinase (ribokinase family)